MQSTSLNRSTSRRRLCRRLTICSMLVSWLPRRGIAAVSLRSQVEPNNDTLFPSRRPRPRSGTRRPPALPVSADKQSGATSAPTGHNSGPSLQRIFSVSADETNASEYDSLCQDLVRLGRKCVRWRGAARAQGLRRGATTDPISSCSISGRRYWPFLSSASYFSVERLMLRTK